VASLRKCPTNRFSVFIVCGHNSGSISETEPPKNLPLCAFDVYASILKSYDNVTGSMTSIPVFDLWLSSAASSSGLCGPSGRGLSPDSNSDAGRYWCTEKKSWWHHKAAGKNPKINEPLRIDEELKYIWLYYIIIFLLYHIILCYIILNFYLIA